MWNLKQKLQSFVLDPASFLTEEMFQEIIWIAFYKTADTLLDMVLCIEKDKAETLLSKNKVMLAKKSAFEFKNMKKGKSTLKRNCQIEAWAILVFCASLNSIV